MIHCHLNFFCGEKILNWFWKFSLPIHSENKWSQTGASEELQRGSIFSCSADRNGASEELFWLLFFLSVSNLSLLIILCFAENQQNFGQDIMEPLRVFQLEFANGSTINDLERGLQGIFEMNFVLEKGLQFFFLDFP